MPVGFRAALDANPDDMTTRLVLADWLDENDRPLEAEAWRWSVEKNMCPVFIPTSDVGRPVRGTDDFEGGEIEVAAGWCGRWNWFGSGWETSEYARAAWGVVSMPGPSVNDSAFALLAAMVEHYVNVPPWCRRMMDAMEPRKPYAETTNV